VRLLAITVAGLCWIAPAIATAESGEEMRARGEQLAKDGRFTEAIDAFKAAERIEPRARHACLIALAYTRRELWPQAEIWLELCESRATPSDPVPEWVPVAKQQLAERLSTVNVAPVEIKVEPAGTKVRLAVSSFAPDELFDPRTIHLPPGRHVIIATAPGFNDAQKTVEVVDKSPQQVTITMLPVTDGKGAGVVAPLPPRSKVPLVVMGTGGGLVVVGAILHATFYRNARNNLADARSNGDEKTGGPATDKWSRARAITIGVYGVGAATLVTGLILKVTVFKQKEAPVAVSVLPTDGGGMLSLEWSR
jgi:hypothetical protein